MALTTASAPRETLATSSALVWSPLTNLTRESGDCTAAGSRTMPTTSCLRRSASATTRWPTFPVAPKTTILTIACQSRVCARARRALVYESAALGVGDRLQAVMRAKLPVDVVKMIAKRLAGDTELFRDRSGVAAFSEEFQDATLLL